MSNEHVLSQELSHLSPFTTKRSISSRTTTSSYQINIKKIIGANLDIVPDYLNEKNPIFEKQIETILPPTSTISQCRSIAILMYKIMRIDIIQSLWLIYRQSGTGELQSNISYPLTSTKFIWPKQVRSLMKQMNQYRTMNTNENSCLTFVDQCLHLLSTTIQQYRNELNVQTSGFIGYNRSLEFIIERFVKQRIESTRIQINQQITNIQYYFHDQLLENKFVDQNPNKNQIRFIKRLCKLKYQMEISKHEVDFLEKRNLLFLSKHTLENESIGQIPSIIDSLGSNSPCRQQLYQQYRNVTETTRKNMMNLSMEYSQRQMQEYQHKYDHLWKQTLDQQMSSSMIELIEERFQNTTKYIEQRFKLKLDLFYLTK